MRANQKPKLFCGMRPCSTRRRHVPRHSIPKSYLRTRRGGHARPSTEQSASRLGGGRFHHLAHRGEYRMSTGHPLRGMKRGAYVTARVHHQSFSRCRENWRASDGMCRLPGARHSRCCRHIRSSLLARTLRFSEPLMPTAETLFALVNLLPLPGCCMCCCVLSR